MSPYENWALYLAIYGALVSTILGIKEIFSYRKKVSMFIEYIAFEERAQLLINNNSKRQITIIDVSLEVKFDFGWDQAPKSEIFATFERFPMSIQSYNYLLFPLSDLVSSALTESQDNIKIKVVDSDGKTYSKYTYRLLNAKWGGISKM